MTADRYERYLEELSTTYFEKLDPFEKKFTQDVRAKAQQFGVNTFTPNRKAFIDKLVGKYITSAGNTPAPRQGAEDTTPIERGRYYVNKTSGGWQIHIDGIPVGNPVDRKTAVGITYWLEDALEQLAQFVFPPEPGKESAKPASAGKPVSDF